MRGRWRNSPNVTGIAVATRAIGRPAMVHGGGFPCCADRVTTAAGGAGHRGQDMRCRLPCLRLQLAGGVVATRSRAIGRCGNPAVAELGRQPGRIRVT